MGHPPAKRTRKREDLIRVGRALIVRKGFNATGLSDILSTAEVPKGSFYYYFDSKEDFGLAIIEDSAISYRQKLDNTLGNVEVSPLARLENYFNRGIEELEASQFEEGCLFGNLAQEMSAQNPLFRDRLNEIFSECESRLVQCLEAAHEEEQTTVKPSAELAQFIFSSWQGALLRSKLAVSAEPLHTFVKVVFEQTLGAPVPSSSNAQKSAVG